MQIVIEMDTLKTYVWQVTPDMEYDFVWRFFVVKKNGQWVGMYATDRIRTVEVR